MFRLAGPRMLLVVAMFAASMAAAPAAHGVAGFGDVAADRFYTEAVQWMVDEGITTGTAPGCFSPEQTATRGEVAVFLHRLVGEPAVGSESFDDVHPSDFFADAVDWMAVTGITKGTGPSTFSPGRAVTRGEVATFLHRLVGEPDGGEESFVDVEPEHFFGEAVAWMAAGGITTGTTPFTFSPERAVSRGEVATFLYRYMDEPSVDVAEGGVCSTDQHAPLIIAEAYSYQLLDGVRSSAGVHNLTRNAEMDAYARQWSAFMHDQDDFAHSTGPFAENIAWWSAGGRTPEEAAARLHDLWVNSSGHYQNMTNAGYTEIGIGFWQGPGGWYATHVFR